MRKIIFLGCIFFSFLACKKEPVTSHPLSKNTTDTNRWATIWKNDITNFIAISFSNRDTGFVELYNDTILRQCILATHDGGKTWTKNICNFTNSSYEYGNYTLKSVDNIIFLHKDSALYKSVDNGINWAKLGISFYGGESNDCYYPIDSSHILLRAWQALLLSSNGGKSWADSVLLLYYDGLNVHNFSFISDKIGFFIADENSEINSQFIKKTTDGGQTWVSLNTPIPFDRLQFVTEKVGYGFTDGWNNTDNKWILYKTTDGGQNWQTVYQLPANTYWNDVHFINADTGYYYTPYKIYCTMDGGKTWGVDFTLKGAPAYVYITDWSFAKTGEAYVITNWGRIIKKMY
jgi:photosystem II stability/assembly factor-like uncharacterized protein